MLLTPPLTARREVRFDPSHRLYEVDGVIAMLLQAVATVRMLGSKMMSLGAKTAPVLRELVSSAQISVFRFKLSAWPRSSNAMTMTAAPYRRTFLADEGTLPRPFFRADRVDNGFPLNRISAGFDHAPLRAVDHKRHARDFRLAANQIQKSRHGTFGVNHALIHIHVEDVGSAADLLPRDSERAVKILAQDQFENLGGTSDVGSLAHDNKPHLGRNVERFESGQLEGRALSRPDIWDDAEVVPPVIARGLHSRTSSAITRI